MYFSKKYDGSSIKTEKQNYFTDRKNVNAYEF